MDFFGKELLAGKSTKIEWMKPVFAGDMLTGRDAITRLTPRSAKNGLVEASFEVFNQNVEMVLTDMTEAVVKCRMK